MYLSSGVENLILEKPKGPKLFIKVDELFHLLSVSIKMKPHVIRYGIRV